jgi:hypothetical protein
MDSARPADFLKVLAEYEPFETNRASKYLYEMGKPVYLLTPPDRQGVFVVRSWSDHVDKTMTEAKLPELGTILSLPKGWTFSVKTLDQDLTIAPQPPIAQRIRSSTTSRTSTLAAGSTTPAATRRSNRQLPGCDHQYALWPVLR